jgi:pimeloyl-ACP methyl ester carboxylesterase
MKATLVLAIPACAYAARLPFGSTPGLKSEQSATPRESLVPVGGAELYAREIGKGTPVIVLHGGPDFDHSYLLPKLDRLSDAFHLIYYDQRGRGRSAVGVKPEDVTLAFDIADMEKVRQYFKLDSVVLLGHSWGTVLALEYAVRYPQRVSRMILMNPASADDYKHCGRNGSKHGRTTQREGKPSRPLLLTRRAIPRRSPPTTASISSLLSREPRITKSSCPG